MELLQEPSTHVRPFVYMSFIRHDLRQIYVPFVAQTDASILTVNLINLNLELQPRASVGGNSD